MRNGSCQGILVCFPDPRVPRNDEAVGSVGWIRPDPSPRAGEISASFTRMRFSGGVPGQKVPGRFTKGLRGTG